MATRNLLIMLPRMFFSIKTFLKQNFNKLVFVILAVLGFLVLWAIIDYVDPDQVLKVVSDLSFGEVVFILSFVFVIFGIAAWRWQNILRGYGYEKNFFHLLGIIFKSSAISLILPSFQVSGETYKAFALKRHEVSVPASFASVFFDYFIVLITNLVLGVGLLIYVLQSGFSGGLTGGAILGLCLVFSSLFFVLRQFFRRGWFSGLILKTSPVVHYASEKTLEDVKLFDFGVSFFLKESRFYLIKAFLISFLGFIWEFCQIGLILYFLEVPFSFLSISVFYLAINFFNSIPVFGGLGFGEAGAFLAGASLGISDVSSLSLSLLLRLRQAEMLIVGFWLMAGEHFGGLSRQVKK